MNKILTKRSILGTILLILLIGEPTVGYKTRIFTPSGMIVFFFLYLSLFHIFDSIIYKYHLVIYQVILLTFAIYSVFVTGFLNKELTEYVLKPNIFITLIRIQASFFVAFAFYLLNRILPRKEGDVLSIKLAFLIFTLFILILSLTGMWGIPSILFTLKTVSLLSLLFGAMGIAALYVALHTQTKPKIYESKKFMMIIYFCLLMGAIPNLGAFAVLLFTMTIAGLYIFFSKTARNHPL